MEESIDNIKHIICPSCYKRIPSMILIITKQIITIQIYCSCLSKRKVYSLHDYMNNQNSTPYFIHMCGKHNSKQIKYCADCFDWQCMQCLIEHSKMNPNHQFLINNELDLKCSEHKLEYSSYCIQCKCHLCHQCYSNDKQTKHQNHQIVQIPTIDITAFEDNYSKVIQTIKTIQASKDTFIIKLDSLIKEASEDEEKSNQWIIWKEEIIKAFEKNQDTNSQLNQFFNNLIVAYKVIQSSPNYYLSKLLSNVQFNQLTFNFHNDEDNESQFNKLKTMLYSFCIVTINSDIRCIGKLNEHISYVNSVIQLNNDSIATGSDDCSIKIWNPNTMTVLKTISNFSFPINCLLQLKDGRLLSGTYNSIFIWDIVSFEEKGSLQGHGDFIYAMTQLDNGFIASGSRDSTIKLWDEKTLCLKVTLLGHQDSIYCLAQLSNKTLISGSCDNSIMVWNIESFQNETIFKGHKDAISSVLQLNDSTIASGSYDKSIKIWDLTSKCSLTSLIGHNNYLLCLMQLKNGNLISSSCDNMIKIWDLKTFKCVSTMFVSHSVRCFIQLTNEQLACGSHQFIGLYLL